MQRFKYAQAFVQDEDVILDEDVLLEENPSSKAVLKCAEKPKRIRRILILCTELDNKGMPLGKSGSTVIFHREPSYPRDKWAMQVLSEDGNFLGYIPYGKNQSAARLMDAGRTITGEIMDDSLRVAVYLETEVQNEEEETT